MFLVSITFPYTRNTIFKLFLLLLGITFHEWLSIDFSRFEVIEQNIIVGL